MNKLTIVCAALIGGIFPALTQVTLQPGENFTFEFNDFHLLTLNGPGGPATQVLFSPFDIGRPDGRLRFEAFENNLTEAPVMDISMFIASPLNLGPAAWHDLQGVVRFTALTEPVTITGLGVQITLPDQSTYFQAAPVPEPSMGLLLVVTTIGILVWRSRKAHRNITSVRSP